MDLEWKEPYVHVQTVSPPIALKVITLDKKYHPGQGDLVVYFNGIYAVRDKDYKEISPYTVEFTYFIQPEDVVTFHYQKLW